jgi:hypothetical protein
MNASASLRNGFPGDSTKRSGENTATEAPALLILTTATNPTLFLALGPAFHLKSV